jgi:hypothetical protein
VIGIILDLDSAVAPTPAVTVVVRGRVGTIRVRG